jgi:hypothetical protein
MSPLRLALGAALLIVAAGCTRAPAPPPAAPTAFTPVLSVKELMEHIVDPVADWVFDAATIDVSAAGVTETKPTSDEDWLKVERGALMLAEASNLLMIERPVAPPGSDDPPHEPGKPAPELSAKEIQAKIDADRAMWNAHADQLRVASLGALKLARARNVDKLFEAGAIIDNACESCHLEYWYPGDKAAVEADRQKRATWGQTPERGDSRP